MPGRRSRKSSRILRPSTCRALVTSDEVDWSEIDVVFCGLPHGTAHGEIAKLPERVKVIDMSADFRLRDPAVYAEWYGGEHGAPRSAARTRSTA